MTRRGRHATRASGFGYGSPASSRRPTASRQLAHQATVPSSTMSPSDGQPARDDRVPRDSSRGHPPTVARASRPRRRDCAARHNASVPRGTRRTYDIFRQDRPARCAPDIPSAQRTSPNGEVSQPVGEPSANPVRHLAPSGDQRALHPPPPPLPVAPPRGAGVPPAIARHSGGAEESSGDYESCLVMLTRCVPVSRPMLTRCVPVSRPRPRISSPLASTRHSGGPGQQQNRLVNWS